MIELSPTHTDVVSGGNFLTDAAAVLKFTVEGFRDYMTAMSYVGGRLNNYYGPETTLEIIAAGNMGA